MGHALDLLADLALRHQAYRMEGDKFDGVKFDQDYTFLLPRVGASWQAAPTVQVYGSWSGSQREPAFRDLYDAEGVGAVPLYGHIDPATGAYSDPLIRPEHVNDAELGATWRAGAASLTANLFHMDFRDELVYAGQFNTDLGYPVVGNAARSVHQGVELDARMAFGAAAAGAQGAASGFDVSANATFSDNHFIEYQEVYGTAPGDTLHYDGNAIGFFPDVMANAAARWSWKRTSLGLEAQYAGRIFVDNTATDVNSIAPRTVLNLSAGQNVRVAGNRLDVVVRLLNATDKRYETSGYLDYDAAGNLVPQLIPAATRSWLAQVTLAF
jgi:iron complex outermembrane receptor protein